MYPSQTRTPPMRHIWNWFSAAGAEYFTILSRQPCTSRPIRHSIMGGSSGGGKGGHFPQPSPPIASSAPSLNGHGAAPKGRFPSTLGCGYRRPHDRIGAHLIRFGASWSEWRPLLTMCPHPPRSEFLDPPMHSNSLYYPPLIAKPGSIHAHAFGAA